VSCQDHSCIHCKKQLRPAALPAAAAAAADEIESPKWEVKIQKERFEKMANNPYSNLSEEVQTALANLNSDDSRYQPQNAHELFKLEQAVQIFFVTIDGHVSTFSAPETLRIFQFTEASEDSSNVFLQVGGWTQPLVPGASPCLQAENGAIMFPDIYSEQSGCSVGLVLVEGLVPDEARAQLLALLQQHTALKTNQQLPPEQQLGKVGSSIVWGAEKLAVGIEMGAEKAGELIEYVTDAAEKRLSKSDEDAKVGALTKHSVKAAVTATDATVKVSGYVADRVGNLTKRMASYLAAKVVDPNKPGGIKKGGSAMGTLVDAARGGLVAYGTVYNGLEANAKVLGNNLKENSVKVVQHKYGNQAGDEFGKACTAAGNAAMTYMNVQSLGAKGLVKKTAKNTGKNIAKNIVGMGSEEKKEVTQEDIKQ